MSLFEKQYSSSSAFTFKKLENMNIKQWIIRLVFTQKGSNFIKS